MAAGAILFENDSHIGGITALKRLFPALLCALLLTACAPAEPPLPEEDGRLRIAATIFPAYDFARAAAGDLAEVTLLLPPGAESHSYEPTPADILAVRECDLFVCLGGESDAWVDAILDAVRPGGETLRMMDCVELLEEGEEAGEHHHHHEEGQVEELDEHVWTDPKNAAAITRAAGEALCALDPANAEGYRANAEGYARQLEALDGEFSAFFAEHPRTMVFGDRFPLRYFAEAYNLDCRAAFPGCGGQTEPSAAVIAYLIEKVEEESLSTVWYIEFSNHLVADAVAEAAGAETALFHSCHSVSQADLDAGATYLTLMEANLEALRTHMP